MENWEYFLEHVSAQHRIALRWFAEHTSTILPWPTPLSDGTLLATKAKGIYKPNWTKYALSVRQALNSPYYDVAPVVHPDGTWSYSYFQENSNPADRDSAYTNRALIACYEDKIPIGVMRQVSIKPRANYQILGLALVTKWENGYFLLEGLSNDKGSYNRNIRERAEKYYRGHELDASIPTVFNLQDILDERTRVISAVVQRRGQSEFRQNLLQAYENQCCISGCDAVETLEAAHIVPYQGLKTNHPSNGLLLRADLHVLFDLGLLAVDTKTMSVVISSSLANTTYSTLSKIRLRLPKQENINPNKEALDLHRAWTGL